MAKIRKVTKVDKSEKYVNLVYVYEPFAYVLASLLLGLGICVGYTLGAEHAAKPVPCSDAFQHSVIKQP